MRLTELLGSRLETTDRQPLGVVRDIRVVGHRVDGLVVSRRALGATLGLHRPKVTGPWPLTVIYRRLHRHMYLVAWEDVQRRRDGRLVASRVQPVPDE